MKISSHLKAVYINSSTICIKNTIYLPPGDSHWNLSTSSLYWIPTKLTSLSHNSVGLVVDSKQQSYIWKCLVTKFSEIFIYSGNTDICDKKILKKYYNDWTNKRFSRYCPTNFNIRIDTTIVYAESQEEVQSVKSPYAWWN